PVELSAFTVSRKGNKIALNWTTSTETNNKGFSVQRSKDKAVWESLTFVKGNGTSTNINTYSFIDEHPYSVKSYYRLTQEDYDGSIKTYPYAETNTQLINSYSLEQNYPNPFNPSTTISYAIPVKQKVIMKVFDVLGNEVSVLVNGEQEAGTHLVSLNAKNLPSGIYIYKIQAGTFSQSRKMLLVK
ncbi:MAG: T9SS type A sorting domain-containing protein, partial [Bacteroidota bacterium]|nr:T9SS type A sorting domain-containing protein [Bacteroidota bacterium]